MTIRVWRNSECETTFHFVIWSAKSSASSMVAPREAGLLKSGVYAPHLQDDGVEYDPPLHQSSILGSDSASLPKGGAQSLENVYHVLYQSFLYLSVLGGL